MLEGKLGRGIVNKHILKFPEEGLKQLQFFMEGLSFPVAVAAYTEQDIVKISYLVRLLQRGDIHSTYALCIWCIRQGIIYQILFRFSFKAMIRNPVRTYDYLRLQRLLKKCREQTLGKSR